MHRAWPCVIPPHGWPSLTAAHGSRTLDNRSSHRKGELPAREFVKEFRQVCGSQPEATAALLEVAALLPTRDQQLALQQHASQPTSTRLRPSTGPNDRQPMARGQRTDPSEGSLGFSAPAVAGEGECNAARQAAVEAPADLEAAADSSVRAQSSAADPRISRSANVVVERMLDDSWMASHDSRYVVLMLAQETEVIMCRLQSWSKTFRKRTTV